MKYDIEAYTDVASFAIYDPAAVPHLLDGSIDVVKASDEEVRRGNILHVEAVSDGDERLRVFLDEDPPEGLKRRREHKVADCLVRLPSGRLVFSGLEDLWTRRRKGVSAEEFEAGTGSECKVPPGNYLAEAFGVEWGDDLDRLCDEVKSPADRFVDRCVGPLMGLVIFCTVLVLPAVLAIVFSETGWRGVWTVVKYALIVHAVFWPLVLLYFKSSGAWSPEYRKKEQEILTEHPTTVVSLKRLPDDKSLDGYAGGRLYVGYGPTGPFPKSANKSKRK